MPRAGLSTQAVVEEAERLADEAGMDALTLAALAERLGVRQPSLYKHIASLGALRTAIATRSVTDLNATLGRVAVGRSEAITAIAHAYRAWAKPHPGCYQAIQAAPATDEAELQAAAVAFLGMLSDVMAGFGLGEDEAIDAIRSLRSAMHGFVTLEAVGGFALRYDLDRSYDRLVAAIVASFRPAARDLSASAPPPTSAPHRQRPAPSRRG